MFVISDRLTIGQVTFVLRVVIQILGYGGLFLIGLIILGNSPRIAPLDTHDILNRVVGKSTATSNSLRWLMKHIFSRNRNHSPSSLLFFAIILSLVYGLFVTVSDVGLIGLEVCTVADRTFQSFPASVSSEADARAVVGANILKGVDPGSVRSYKCASASEFVFNENVTESVCHQWLNSTYGDPSSFRILNTTDSDVLMNRDLTRYNYKNKDTVDINTYFAGATALPINKPTVKAGIAVLPHDTGVRMVIGNPQLSSNQRVTMPKTMALEVEVGCMHMGLIGMKDDASFSNFEADYMQLDEFYKPTRRARYTGPEVFIEPLEKAADAIREILPPRYNTSTVDSDGFMQSFNLSTTTFSLQTVLSAWQVGYVNDISYSELQRFVLGNCSEQVHQSLNVATPPKSVNKVGPVACGFYSLAGSFYQDSAAIRGFSVMVCATTTSVNMVSATLEVDAQNKLTAQLTRLPSDLNIVRANYYGVFHDSPGPGDITWLQLGVIERYTLSDNPSGNTKHPIYQQYINSATGRTQHGVGSIGEVFSKVGAVMVSVGFPDDESLSIVNNEYYSAGNFSTSYMTKWAGAVGASYLLGSLGYNGWAALDKEPLRIESTGGKGAVCYKLPYGIAFLPLLLAAFIVVVWVFQMLITARLRGTKQWENMYGGLAPKIISPMPGKTAPDDILAWEHGSEQPHLKPVHVQTSETEMLVSPIYVKTEYVP